MGGECRHNRARRCKCITIPCLPVTIDRSGEYCLKKNLVYDGTTAAITINVDGVKINGRFHKISLSRPGTITDTTWNPNVGIKMNGPLTGENRFKNVTIKNLIVESLVNTPNPAPLP